jgi:hypothetical protein
MLLIHMAKIPIFSVRNIMDEALQVTGRISDYFQPAHEQNSLYSKIPQFAVPPTRTFDFQFPIPPMTVMTWTPRDPPRCRS